MGERETALSVIVALYALNTVSRILSMTEETTTTFVILSQNTSENPIKCHKLKIQFLLIHISHFISRETEAYDSKLH